MSDPQPQHHQLLIEAALDAVIVSDERDRVLEWNHSAALIFGYSRTEALGIRLTDLMPERYREAHRAAMERVSAGGEPRLAGRVLRMEGLRRDGTEFPIEIRLSTLVVEGGGRVYGAFIRDVTEAVEVEARLRTQFLVTEAIAGSQSLMDAVPKIVEVICRDHGWSAGAAWLVGPLRDALRCTFFWAGPTALLDEFRVQSEAARFASGEGLPGRAWSEREPQWIVDITHAGNFPRRDSALAAGLRSALAFPVIANGEVAGVFEFFADAPRPVDPGMLEMMSYVGRQIGLLMQRAYAHESVANIVQQMHMGLFIFELEDADDSRSLRLKSWNPASERMLRLAGDKSTVDSLVCGLDTSPMREAFAEVVRTQTGADFQNVRCIGHDGTTLVLNVRAFPLPNSCVSVAFEDVTAYARAEQLLASERELLALIARGVTLETFKAIATHCAESMEDSVYATIALAEGNRLIRCHEVPLSAAAAEELERRTLSQVATASRVAGLSVEVAISAEDAPARNPEVTAAGIRTCWATPFPSGCGVVMLYGSGTRPRDEQQQRLLSLYASISSIAAERLAAETSLRVSERRFRTLTLATTHAVWRSDPGGQIIDVSAAGPLEPEHDFLREGWMRLVHPDERERAEDEWVRARTEQKPFQAVLRLAVGGQYRDFAIRGVPLVEEGEVIEWTGTASDITARLNVERELHHREQRLRLVVEATTDVAWDLDLKTGRQWWSEGFTTRFGHDHNATSLASWTDNIHPDDAERVTHGMERAIERRDREWSDEYRYRRADGSYVQIVDRGILVLDGSGDAVRMIGAMTDVTERRVLESQLEQMKRVSGLGRLAASMAHEFNNVLMGIQPFTEVIRRLTPEQQKIQDATGRILQSIQRGRKVTEEILRFTRRIDPVIAEIDVREWLRDFRHEAEALCHGHLEVSITDPGPGLMMRGDVAQLNQVLANLVINARDASPRGAALTIETDVVGNLPDDDDDFVHIRVRDQGSGIDRATLDHIFDPLFTTKRGGTGLGLAVSHQMITKHGGRIYAESTVGIGSTFHLLLPRSKRGAVQHSTDPPAIGMPKSAVIIDDETDIADGIAQLLGSEGIDSVLVDRGALAVDAIEQHAPEVVLLDIGLPDMSGVDVFHAISARWPDLPVIFMTGHYSRADIGQLLKLPHVGFLQKPFEIDELLALLSRHHWKQ